MNKIKVYDLKKYVENANPELEVHELAEVAIIVSNSLVLVVDYEAVGVQQNVTSDSLWVNQYSKAKVNKDGSKSISVFPCAKSLVIIQEIIDGAAYKEMSMLDFFKRYNYNDRCRSNFRSMCVALSEDGFDINNYLPMNF